jgi:hypothetical protein
LRVAAVLAQAIVATTALAGPTRAPEHIYAQELVDRTVKENPDLWVVAMHVTPPHETENVIIASNIGRIGKLADAEDLHVIQTGETLAKVSKNHDRFEVELPLLDASKRPVGALAIVFPYHEGDDPARFKARAEKIRDELAGQIPDVARLVQRIGATK